MARYLPEDRPGGLRRILKAVGVALLVLVAAIATAVLIAPADDPDLPFDYGGFD